MVMLKPSEIRTPNLRNLPEQKCIDSTFDLNSPFNVYFDTMKPVPNFCDLIQPTNFAERSSFRTDKWHFTRLLPLRQVSEASVFMCIRYTLIFQNIPMLENSGRKQG